MYNPISVPCKQAVFAVPRGAQQPGASCSRSAVCGSVPSVAHISWFQLSAEDVAFWSDGLIVVQC